jgi:cyclic beta-1,2-glucan synthetase
MAVLRPSALVSAAPFLVLWGSSKTICGWLNEPRGSRAKKIGIGEKALLRNAALRTWRFFREFSNAEENWLIPDAVQETPLLVEHLVSPTNLGLLLDSRLAAYDLGFLTLPEFVSATERTFETLERMPTHNGHFYNWYDTLTLEPVEPRFVSTVDSGNLICCLWTLRQACLGFARQPLFRKALWDGVHDHLVMLEGILASGQEEESAASSVRDLKSKVKSLAASNWTHLEALPGLAAEIMALEERCSTAEASGEIRWWVHELSLRVSNLQDTVYDFAPWIMPQFAESCRETGTRGRFRIEDLTVESLSTIRTALEERFSMMETSEGPSHKTRAETDVLRSLLCRSEGALRDITARLARLAARADSLARKMDFGYLYDPERKLLSIGYDAKEGRRCNNAYDLLASEARAAAFVAIAKGEIPQESWFHLGRLQTTLKSGRVLLSWTGTMFEYLLPSLWMRSDPNTLLEQTVRTAVRAQQEFAVEKSIPWGVSESSCRETNPDGRYQYRAFGSPALALNRQQSDELVVAPYATFLGLLVDASGAMSNLERMREMGWLGAYGFYEACDFTPPRSGGDNGGELVRCWMAHHQGMSLVSVANVLCNSSMQRRFHAEPMVAAVERLLQEKFPPPPALDAVIETREELLCPSPSAPRLAAD